MGGPHHGPVCESGQVVQGIRQFHQSVDVPEHDAEHFPGSGMAQDTCEVCVFRSFGVGQFQCLGSRVAQGGFQQVRTGSCETGRKRAGGEQVEQGRLIRVQYFAIQGRPDFLQD